MLSSSLADQLANQLARWFARWIVYWNLANSITLPIARDLDRELVCCDLAEFHYAIQVAHLVAGLVCDLSQTGSSYLDMSRYLEPGRRPVQAIFHCAILLASRSQTSSRPNSIFFLQLLADCEPAREPASELVADVLASWSQAG